MSNNPKKTRRWGKQIGNVEEDKKNSNIGRHSKKKRNRGGNESRKEQRTNERGRDKKKEQKR
jgi:hypothetical protein